MKKLIFLLLVSFLSFNSLGQMKTDGKWYFPDSVKSLCVNTEQGLVSSFKGLIEWNRTPLETRTSQHYEISESQKNYLRELENTWDKLGCVYILYGKK